MQYLNGEVSGLEKFISVLTAFTPVVQSGADTAVKIIGIKAGQPVQYVQPSNVPSYLQNSNNGQLVTIPAATATPTNYTPFLIAGGLGIAGLVAASVLLKGRK